MLVDSHCHLDFPELSADLDGVYARMDENGVAGCVTISTRIRKLGAVRTIAETRPNTWFTVGTHPNNAHEELDISTDEIVTLAQHPLCIGIGEAGLDYHYDYAPPEAQAQGFRTHIAAARETGLPLIIHARSADEDIAATLEEETGKGAFPFVLHCFSSGTELARRGLALGGYVSFSGILTFKRSQELRDIARDLPHDRLLVETDAPYLAPQPYRGKRNEPAYVTETAKVLADTIGVSVEEAARLTTDNFFRLFSKMPRPDGDG